MNLAFCSMIISCIKAVTDLRVVNNLPLNPDKDYSVD